MKNVRLKFFIIALSLLLFFSGCSNLFNGSVEDKNLNGSSSACILVYGSIDIDSYSRTAFATPVTGGHYSVSAVKGTSSVTGTINSENSSYEIALTSGGIWTISIKKYNDSNEEILRDTWQTLNLSDDATGISHNFTLRPLSSSSGRGSVNLPMTVPGTVKSVTMACSDENWNAIASVEGESAAISSSSTASGSYSVDIYFYSDANTQNGSTLLYCCCQTINVFDNLTTDSWVNSGSDECISDSVFTLTEVLIDSFRLSTFYVSPGGDDDNMGTFFSPLKTLSTIASRVSNGSAEEYTVFIVGSVEQSGEFEYSNESKTLNIKKYGSSDAVIKYTGTASLSNGLIHHSGGKLNMTDIIIDGNDTARCLYIENSDQANTTFTAESCTFQKGKSSTEGGCIFSGMNTKAELKDCSVTLGQARDGGGIFNLGTMTISGGAINGNKATGTGDYGRGGGICNNVGSLFMSGSLVVGDSSATSAGSSSSASNSAQYGGGIACIGSGKLYLGYSEESTKSGLTGGLYKNYASVSGGGIYIGSSATLQMDSGNIFYNGSKEGGGVYSKAPMQNPFKLTGGTLGKNEASTNGGAIYIAESSYFYMSGSASIGSQGKGNSAKSGGGIYSKGVVFLGYTTTNTTANLTGGIFYNKATKDGGGICIAGTSANLIGLKMSSGTIENNYVTEGLAGGGGVYVYCSKFKMLGGTIKSNTIESPINTSVSGGALNLNTSATLMLSGSASIPYGGEQYKNDISQKGSDPIQITEALTSNFNACVIPYQYNAGTQILDKDGVSSSYEKFKLLDENCLISSAGKICRQVFYISDSGNDDNLGSFEKPLKTLTKALSSITSQAYKIDYTIKIKDTCTGSTTIDTDSNHAESILLTGDTESVSVTINTSTGSISGVDYSLSAGGDNTLLTIDSEVPITIKNLKLTGVDSSTDERRVITMPKGDLTLDAGACITGNKNTAYVTGFGIYVGNETNAGEVKLLIKSGAYITGNEIARGYGCGIELRSGIVTMEGGEISYNKITAGANNGGCGVNTDGGTFNMNGGAISHNAMLNQADGGGVRTAGGTFYLTGGEISYNGSGLGPGGYGQGIRGAGICMMGGTVEMSGGTVSYNNSANWSGGGVRIQGNAFFKMTGGTITHNTTTETNGPGAGVFLQKSGHGSYYIPDPVADKIFDNTPSYGQLTDW